MRRTRAELRAELLKAGRGAGLPLGVAEELALAGPWITPAALADLLVHLGRAEGRRALCAMVSDLDHGRAVPGPIGAALTQARGAVAEPVAALDLDPPLWAQLTGLGARTYVPETAQSRQSGAGAGDIDND